MSPTPAVQLETAPPMPSSSHEHLQCRATAVDAEQERTWNEELVQAETLLAHDCWEWVRTSVQVVEDELMQLELKHFFLRLYRAMTAQETTAVLDEMEAWRDYVHIAFPLQREERESIQAMFMLGVDKQMSLQHAP
ncbi:hypothetical protein Poli38472_007005 [Pythium oligandrum]|uniref:Uncharacterized protein n=1 Tax=Pythium oligandrum TaxID=41045 RepID=A0A8K1FCY7_PYTOL|nr:hypothetical protein Poli38472_007005 [Pythium oligandrum]|eukprot:TMW58860.1 hypothetical protein Poli38472_007005 [Pythium oligandrum]